MDREWKVLLVGQALADDAGLDGRLRDDYALARATSSEAPRRHGQPADGDVAVIADLGNNRVLVWPWAEGWRGHEPVRD